MAGISPSRQKDMFDESLNLNNKTGAILDEMKQLAKDAQAGNITSQKLQQIQIKLADLQRDLETMKQLEEKMAKAMENMNKFPQAQ